MSGETRSASMGWLYGSLIVNVVLVVALAISLIDPSGSAPNAERQPTPQTRTDATTTTKRASEHLLAAPTDLVMEVLPNSCTPSQCLTNGRFVNHSSGVSAFRFYLDDGTRITDTPAPPGIGPGTLVTNEDLPGYPTPTGVRFCVYVVAVNAADDESAPSNTVCFTLDGVSSGPFS